MTRLEASSLVACGTLRRELGHLVEEGALAPAGLRFLPPGLHEWPSKLEEKIHPKLDEARAEADDVLVVYGEKCFLDIADPARDMDALLSERGPGFRRVRAKHCVDMLASAAEREAWAGGDKVYWLTPGWVESWKYIFRFWDAGKANEMFPAYDRAVMLDPLGFFETLSEKDPEKILGISDWMKLPLEPHPVTLDRFTELLTAPPQG